MSEIVNRSVLQPGDLIHRLTGGFVGKSIQWATGAAWNHDAIIVQVEGHLFIGDALMGRECQITPIYEWEQDCRKHGHKILITRPAFALPNQGASAAAYWMNHIHNHDYDKVAIARLGLRKLTGKWFTSKIGQQTHFYCTEGVAESWDRGGGINPFWPEVNPTPGTATDRYLNRILREVKDSITNEGWKYRISI